MMLTSPTNAKDARFHSNGFAPARHPAATPALGPSLAPDPTAGHGLKRLASCREELERSWGTDHDSLRCVSHDGAASPEGRRQAKRRKSGPAGGARVAGQRILPRSGAPPPSPSPAAQARPPVKAGWYAGEVDVRGRRHGRGTTTHDDGTAYAGAYFEDLMDGPGGRYTFPTTQHWVPNPHQNGSHLCRHIEKSFEGSFKYDAPHGAGMIVTKTVDRVPPAAAGATPVDVRFLEVVYDAGMYKGKVVGEGVRIVYTATHVGGRSTLEKLCFRSMHGENTGVRVAPSYADWMLQCLNLECPSPPSSA